MAVANNMSLHEKALQWAKQYLTSHEKSTILNHHIVVETSYSIVYKIETSRSTVYLKQVPNALFLDPQTLRFLHQHGCKNIPEIIAENADLNCFMTASCGNISLRHLFNGKVNFEQLKQGIINYTDIQRRLENSIQPLLTLSTPDWRLDKFSALYKQLIQQNQLLLDDGLTNKEIDCLHELYPTCVHLCETISQYNIPETINHCDFQENNMLLDKKSGAINIIDWGETAVTHPFFSLNGCLWNITYFHKIKETDDTYRQLQSQCVAPWLNLYDEATLLEILDKTNQLLGIFAALGYKRLYDITKNQLKTVQQEHPGSIAGCLRTFLKSSI